MEFFKPELGITLESLDDLTKSLDTFNKVVSVLNKKLEILGSVNNLDSFIEFESIVKKLVDVLGQSEYQYFLHENTPGLCSVALFYGLIYYAIDILPFLNKVLKDIWNNFLEYLTSKE